MTDPIRIVCDLSEPPTEVGWYAVERRQLFDTEPMGRFVAALSALTRGTK